MKLAFLFLSLSIATLAHGEAIKLAGGETSGGGPPTPRESSLEEITAIIKTIPGDLCFLQRTELTKTYAGESFYNCAFSNPSGDVCNLQIKVWREQLSKRPGGNPDPSDDYEVRSEITAGQVSKCRCK
jgi:hypothetical protein